MLSLAHPGHWPEDQSATQQDAVRDIPTCQGPHNSTANNSIQRTITYREQWPAPPRTIALSPTHTPGVNRMCQHGASPVVALAAAPAAPAAHTSQQRQRGHFGTMGRHAQNTARRVAHCPGACPAHCPTLSCATVRHCPDIVPNCAVLSRTVRHCPELCGIVVLAGGRPRTGDTAARAAVPRWRRRRPSARSSRGHRSCAACVARDSGGIFACLHCAPGCPAPVPLWTANYGPRRIWLVTGVARTLRGVVYRVVTVQGV